MISWLTVRGPRLSWNRVVHTHQATINYQPEQPERQEDCACGEDVTGCAF